MNERELQVYNAIKERSAGRGVNYTICLYSSMVSSMEEKEFNDIADALVKKGKLKKFKNMFGVTLYSIKDELEDKVSKGRGDFFSSHERKFAAASKQEIINTAHDSVIDFIESSGMTNGRIILNLLLAAARIGLCGTHTLSAAQRELVSESFRAAFNVDDEDLEKMFAVLSQGYDEDDFQMIERFCQTALEIHAIEPAMHLLLIILSYAYIDGKLDDEVGGKLESIFGLILMGNFFAQGPQDEDEHEEIDRVEESKKREEQEAKRREEERKKKEEQEAKRKVEEEKKQKIQAAHDAWKVECSAVEKRRADALKTLMDAERSALEKAAGNRKQTAIDAANANIEKERRRLHEAESALASLGFFSFGQKKQQKSIIEDAQNHIHAAESALKTAEDDYRRDCNEIDQRLRGKQSEWKSKLEREYPMPAEPERPQNAAAKPAMTERPQDAAAKPAMTQNQIENELIKDEICMCLLAGAATPSELYNQLSRNYPEITNQRIAALLRQLRLDGKIDKTVEYGKTYFHVL